MAEFISKYDTKSKKLTLTKDGEAMNDVMHVEFGLAYDSENNKETKHVCHIMQRTKNDDEDYATHVHTVANEEGDLEVKGDNTLSNFVGRILAQHRPLHRKN
jgi:hypothetical protein